jgi:hypothetical protein
MDCINDVKAWRISSVRGCKMIGKEGDGSTERGGKRTTGRDNERDKNAPR